jgi:hypothetical protein
VVVAVVGQERAAKKLIVKTDGVIAIDGLLIACYGRLVVMVTVDR